jgi:hypothetical protein
MHGIEIDPLRKAIDLFAHLGRAISLNQERASPDQALDEMRAVKHA